METSLQTVVKANDLINAKYALTMTELKLVLCAIAQITPDDEDFKTYEIDAREYTDLTGTQNKGESSRLRAITLELMSKPIELPTEDGHEQMNFISYAKYKFNQSKVEIRFDPAMKPFLLKLKKRFTKYRLHYVMQMNSYYSIRLYEMLKQYAPIGRRVFSVDTLHDVLQTPESYRRFGNFRQRVLDTAQAEVNEKTDITFRYETVKTGRSVSDVIFYITTKKGAETARAGEDELPDAPDTAGLKRQLVGDFGLTSGQADIVIGRYAPTYIAEVLRHVEEAERQGKVRNLAAYTYKAVTEDYRGGHAVTVSQQVSQQEASPRPKSSDIELTETQEQERRFEKARDEAVADLLVQYDLATLLEGFETYLEEQEPWLYGFLKDKARKEGEPFTPETFYKGAHVPFKTFVAERYLPKNLHSFGAWTQQASVVKAA